MGARNELQQGFKEMKHNKIKNCSYKKMVQIGFCHDTNNPPGSSHVGGVYGNAKSNLQQELF